MAEIVSKKVITSSASSISSDTIKEWLFACAQKLAYSIADLESYARSTRTNRMIAGFVILSFAAIVLYLFVKRVAQFSPFGIEEKKHKKIQ